MSESEKPYQRPCIFPISEQQWERPELEPLRRRMLHLMHGILGYGDYSREEGTPKERWYSGRIALLASEDLLDWVRGDFIWPVDWADGYCRGVYFYTMAAERGYPASSFFTRLSSPDVDWVESPEDIGGREISGYLRFPRQYGRRLCYSLRVAFGRGWEICRITKAQAKSLKWWMPWDFSYFCIEVGVRNVRV